MKQRNFNIEQQERARVKYERQKMRLFALEAALMRISEEHLKKTGGYPMWTRGFIYGNIGRAQECAGSVMKRGTGEYSYAEMKACLRRLGWAEGEKKVKCVNGCVRVVDAGA